MYFNEEQLKEYGRRLGAALEPGSVAALTGDLGAGKTTLAKAIAAGCGVRETVTSPTFTTVCEYMSGRLPFYHFDVYRLAGGGAENRRAALENISYEEYFFGNGITIIEWADVIKELIPERAVWIDLGYTDDPGVRCVTERRGCGSGVRRPESIMRHAAPEALRPVPEEGRGERKTCDSPRPLLAIETTGPVCSVALRTADGRMFFRSSAEGLMHLTSLLPMIESVMNEAGVSPRQLECIAASAGPGSFTGMRIGIATVRALAQTLGIPVVKAPTLETFVYLIPAPAPVEAASGGARPYTVACPMFDARREQVYAGAFLEEADGRIMTLVKGGAYDPDEYFAALNASLEALKKLAARTDGEGAEVSPRFMDQNTDARAVLLWAERHGIRTGYEALEPIYIRKAEAQRRLDEKAAEASGAVDPPFSVREAAEADVYGISIIERLSFGEPWLEQSILSDIRLEYSDYVVCEDGGFVVGYAGLHRILDEGHITNIAVHPSMRGRGVGSAVLSALIHRAQGKGIRDFMLEVRDGDAAAIGFYEKHGFVSDGLRKDYYPAEGGGREDARLMRRPGAEEAE